MIQRIQSIFLLLSSLSWGSTLLKPLSFGSFQNTPATVTAAQDSLLTVFDNTALVALVIAAAVIGILTIFLFKNRPLQMTVIKGLLVVCLAGLVVLGLMLKSTLDTLHSTEATDDVLVIQPLGFIAPILAIIFSVLAYRAINKDENLVRSSNRLR